MLRMLTAADAISMLNTSFGFCAIIMILWGEQRFAFSFILLALLADGLDGIIARRWGGGKLGESLEAMGDMLSLSIAPLLFFLWFGIQIFSAESFHVILAFLCSLIFLVCSAIRLASFHVMKNEHFFIGLPASVSTIVIICLTVLAVELYLLLIVLLLLALLMVSSIQFIRPSMLMNSIAAVLIILTFLLYTALNGIVLILLVIHMSS